MADMEAEAIAAVDACLDEHAHAAAPPLSLWNRVLSILKSHGLAWSQQLQANSLLVHPLNRGGLGVNGYSCHAKGAALWASGFDSAYLHSSTCFLEAITLMYLLFMLRMLLKFKSQGFELAVDSSIREKQLLFNKSMVNQSSGLLAPVGTQERYMSVSSGHTCQFVKACLHGCPTPEATLADNSGKLNKETLGRDPEFKKLLEAGWQWTVVSSRVEQQWPSLPRLAERALNSSNEAFLKASELELLLYLGEHASSNSTALQCHEVAAELTKTGPISSYSKLVAMWFEQFSHQGLFLKFLGPFSKEFGQNANCGAEFWAGASMALSSQMPMIRLAFLACNLAAPATKISNGYARLILRSDFEKLKSIKMKNFVTEAEDVLFRAWKQIEHQLDNFDALKSFGILCIRMSLHLLGKE